MAFRLLRARGGPQGLLRQLQGVAAAQPLAGTSSPLSSGGLRTCAPSGTPLAHPAAASPSLLPSVSSVIHTPSLLAPRHAPALPLGASLSLRHLSTTPPPGTPAEAGAPDSDDDFKPQYRKPEEVSPIHQLIEEDVKSNPVMVYMKGVPAAPMCGFSNGVVSILKAYGVDFKSRNVLEDEELRQGVKTYSQWPTIPQVYVNGEFVGGCDILFKMHEAGELESLFATVQSKAQ